MPKILITGGAGFIGSNLAAHLLNKNHTIVVLDNYATGSYANIKDLITHPNFTFIEGDIRNLDDCKKATEGVEFVFHQAALGSVPRSIHDPKTTNDVNISGFLNILIAAKDANVKRLIYASSSSVYGDSPDLPKREENIGNPLSPYALTKLVNEQYASVFSKVYKLETIGLRYFNVFGPNQSPDGPYAAVIPKFIHSILHGQPIQINGDGEISRDFTYVENIVEINELAMLANSPEAVNRAYNAATGNRITLNELSNTLINIIAEQTAKPTNTEVIYGPPRPGDIQHSLASIDQARNLLGYSPKFSFSEGIVKTVQWYIRNHSLN